MSLRIRDLEADLGTRLFDRFGPRVAPTQPGLDLAARLTEAFDLIRSAVDTCQSRHAKLRVTAVPTFATRWLAPRLAAYHALPDSAPIQLDASAELRPGDDFDIAIRTGPRNWPGFEAIRLTPVESTPMLSPTLAASVDLTSPRDLAALPLLPHDQWRRWFRECGETVELRFYADDYPTYELDATAAIEGAAVALLSPTLFASLLRERKLVQPFPHVLEGPDYHWLLLRPGEARPAVLRFRQWLEHAVVSERRSPALSVTDRMHLAVRTLSDH